MPEKKVIQRAKRDLRQGKRPTTAAGEFVREEIEHVRGGKHGARSAKQAIAIGLSKARRAGIPLPPRNGKTTKPSRKKPNPRRGRAVKEALEREPKTTTSRAALSKARKEAGTSRKRR